LEEEEFNNEANIVFENSFQLELNVKSIQIESKLKDVINLIEKTSTSLKTISLLI
jgi:hypothetical protein